MRRLSRITLIGTAAVICLCWFTSTWSSTSAQANGEEQKRIVRRWIDEGFNNKELTVVDQVFSSEVVINGQLVGQLGVKRSMNRFITAFPDLRVTITEAIAEGDRVAIWYRVQATHTGEFEGIRPTGKQVRWTGADLFRIVQGRIVECQFVDDSLGLVRQLGATVSQP
jgi:predicted ester cyclase